MKDIKKPKLTILEKYQQILVSILIGICVGAIVSVFDVIFAKGLVITNLVQNEYTNYLLPFLPAAGVAVIFLYEKFGKDCIGGGKMIFDCDQNKLSKLPLRDVPLIIVTSWISHLFGASVGREGASIEIGCSLSTNIGKRFHIDNLDKTLLVTGLAAGFAGLFGTPFTAIFFAMELLKIGQERYNALPSCWAGAFTAYGISKWLSVEKSAYDLVYKFDFNLQLAIKLIVMGILFGLMGYIYTFLLDKVSQKAKEYFKNPYSRIFVGGIVLAVLLFVLHDGRYASLSIPLISNCFSNGTVYSYDWIAKMTVSILSIAIGYRGGALNTLFVMGASGGYIMAASFGLPPEVGAMLGFAACFASGTNVYLSAIMIGMELFGFAYFPLFFVVCSAAFIVNGNRSVYKWQQIESLEL